MQIDDFKTWHWVAVGLLVGLAFSLVLTVAGPPFATAELDTVDASTFEYGLQGQLLRPGQAGLVVRFHRDQPVLRNLIVHPPLAGDDPRKVWVTGQIYKIGPQFKNPAVPSGPQVYVEQWVPFKYPTSVPYRGQNGAVGSFPTVAGYLSAMQQRKVPAFTYRVAWPEKPAVVWSLPPAAGLLSLGVAWPLALGILRSWGLAKPVKVAPPKPAAKPAPAPAPPVRVVVAPPLPPPVPQPVAAGDGRRFGGEFYPVEKKT